MPLVTSPGADRPPAIWPGNLAAFPVFSPTTRFWLDETRAVQGWFGGRQTASGAETGPEPHPITARHPSNECGSIVGRPILGSLRWIEKTSQRFDTGE